MNPAELILIVEDNEPSRLLVRDVLEATGYRTAEARTAEEGLRLARESRPALILAAGFDGYQTKPISVRELLEAVRRLLEPPRPPDTP